VSLSAIYNTGVVQHTYNFEVKDINTYYVGAAKVLVHNCEGGGPAPNGSNAKPHGGVVHNNAIDEHIDRLKADPKVTNIRKNQQQVDVKGDKVGTNRPDIQYDKGGCHYCVEYDQSARNTAGTKM
jgi:hypothetical protein